MTEPVEITGRCLCSVVQFTAKKAGAVDICHCGMCRRWGGGPGFGVEPEGLTWQGEENITVHRSSDWAERGFCKICGTGLFYRLTAPGVAYMNINAFLLDDQTSLTLQTEIFIDEKPDLYAFAGDRTCLTGEEVVAAFTQAHATGT